MLDCLSLSLFFIRQFDFLVFGTTQKAVYLVIGWHSWVEKAWRMARGEVVAMGGLQQRHQLVAAACRLCCDPHCRQRWPKQTKSSNVMSGTKGDVKYTKYSGTGS